MLIILMGISGSGKSTVANALTTPHIEGVRLRLGETPLANRVSQLVVARPAGAIPVTASADDYFTGPDGAYRFDPSQLGAAHGNCLRTVIGALELEAPVVIVDNTNTTTIELAPYIALGQAYEREVVVVALNIGVSRAFERNVHQVPGPGIAAQAERLAKTLAEWPPWWPRPQVFEV